MDGDRAAGPLTWGLKLKRGGRGRPLGRRVLGSRSSSKKGCTHASSAVQRSAGEYCSRRDTRSTASGGIRLWNTCGKRGRTLVVQYADAV